MNTWQSTLAILLLAAIPVSIGYWTGWARTPPDPLDIDSKDLVVGMVRTGRPFSHRITLRNSSSRAVTISRIVASCSCTSVTPSRFELKPRESAALQVTIDPRFLLRSVDNRSEGKFVIQLFVFTEGRSVPQQWHLTGTLQPAVVLSPQKLAFFGTRACIAGRAGPKLEAMATLRKAEHVLAPVEPHPDFEVVCHRDPKEPTKWQVQIVPRQRPTPGRFSTTVWLQAKDANGESLGEWPLRVDGVVEPAISALPSTVDIFPDQSGSTRQNIVLRSNTGTPFTVSSDPTDQGWVTVRPESGEAAVHHSVQLIFDTRAMPDKGELTLRIRYADGRMDNATFAYVVHRFREAPP